MSSIIQTGRLGQKLGVFLQRRRYGKSGMETIKLKKGALPRPFFSDRDGANNRLPENITEKVALLVKIW